MRIALATCANLPDWEVDDRPLHQALTQRGIEHDLVAWTDANADWSRYDGCLIRTTWDYMDRRAAFIEWAERIAAQTMLLNPPAVVRWNTHKGYLRDLEQAGVPVIDTVWLDADSTDALAELIAERDWPSIFIKPAIGATARETMRLTRAADDIERAQQHIDRLRAAGEDLLLQPYLANVESEGEYSAIWFDGAFSHAVRKIPVEGDYRVQDDFGATDEPWNISSTDMALTQAAVTAAENQLTDALDGQPLLYARVDLLRDEVGQLRITELELVEPSLFFRHSAAAAGQLVDALIDRVRSAD